MSCKKPISDKVYVFEWQIENFPSLIDKSYLRSPSFFAEDLQHTKWYMSFQCNGSSKDSQYFCNLYRSNEDEGEERVEVSYEIAFVTANDYEKNKQSENNKLFTRGSYIYISAYPYAFSTYIGTAKNVRKYALKDVVKMRCRIWMGAECPNTKPIRKCAKTVIGCQRGYVDWHFKSSKTGKLSVTPAIKTNKTQKVLNVAIATNADYSLGSVWFLAKLLDDEKPLISIMKVWLINTGSTFKLLESNEIRKDDIGKINEWKPYTDAIDWNKCLTYIKDSYSLGNVLQIRTELIISNGLIVSNTIHGDEIQSIEYNAVSVNPLNNFTDDHILLWEMREKGFLCDFELVNSTGSFPAHRLILSLRSKFFTSYFESEDSNQKKSLVLTMDDDTISRLLRYMYTNCLQLDWDAALKLFTAAEKYEISNLLDECMNYIKENFTPESVCDILLSDEHYNNQQLQKFAIDFFSSHRWEVFQTEIWKNIENSKPHFAIQIFHKIM